MSEEPPAKRVRKGTKSCIECRHRKVRCIWPSEDARTCENCAARHRKCETQVNMLTTNNVVNSSSRARLEILEESVSSLWEIVKNLEAKLEHGEGNTIEVRQSQSTTQADQLLQESSNTSNRNSARLRLNSESSSSSALPANAPTHLLHLFENDMLNSNTTHITDSPAQHERLEQNKTSKISCLMALMPSRKDVVTVSQSASTWLSWSNSLFPINTPIKTTEQMLSAYDEIVSQRYNMDPATIAILLLSLALTVQQESQDFTPTIPGSFVKDVSDTVERVIIWNDDTLATVQGITCTLIFQRLQLGRAKIRKSWLTSRRAIAFAQLIGLSKAAAALQSSPHGEPDSTIQKQQRQRAEVWESLCATDRISSMMWSLPIATAHFTLPSLPVTDDQGQVISQAFLYRLANIVTRIPEIDNITLSGKPYTELSALVMATDQELQALEALTPKSWWQIQPTQLPPNAILQYWHRYITIRTHLQLALAYSQEECFFYNFTSCYKACQDLGNRYTQLRPLLPKGLFASTVIDLQAFSALVFLLLAGYRRLTNSSLTSHDSASQDELAEDMIRVMTVSSDHAGGGFARQSVDAARALKSLLTQSGPSESQNISLNLPLVGKIHLSRKSDREGLDSLGSTFNTQHQQNPLGDISKGQESDSAMPNEAMMDALSFSMEIPDDYLFLTDQALGPEQWLTWTN